MRLIGCAGLAVILQEDDRGPSRSCGIDHGTDRLQQCRMCGNRVAASNKRHLNIDDNECICFHPLQWLPPNNVSSNAHETGKSFQVSGLLRRQDVKPVSGLVVIAAS